jgi:hypothetical protein
MMLAMIVAKLPMLLQAAAPNPEAMTPEQFRQQIALEAVRHGRPDGAVAILVPLGLFAMILLIVWFGTRRRQAEIQARAEVQKHLIDKFGSGPELAAFLGNKENQRFLESLWSQGVVSKNRVLSGLQNGVVLTMLGLGLLGLSFVRHGLLVPGVIVLALGAGFLISAMIAHRLSKKLGSDNGGPGSDSATFHYAGSK